jgi:catechol-2,3-dioxygenase
VVVGFHAARHTSPWEAALLEHLLRHGTEVLRTCEHASAGGVSPSLYILDPEGNQIKLKGPPR